MRQMGLEWGLAWKSQDLNAQFHSSVLDMGDYTTAGSSWPAAAEAKHTAPNTVYTDEKCGSYKNLQKSFRFTIP